MAAGLEAGCAGSASSGEGPVPPAGAGGTFGGVGTGGASATGGASGSNPGTGGIPLPPEQEVESFYQSPVATGRYVWIANPASGRVAYVDAVAVTVRTVEAGNGPTHVAAVPQRADSVLVLNVLSRDASLLDAQSDGTIVATQIPGMPARANSWAVAPDGRWAIAWSDARRVQDANGRPVTLPLVEGLQDVAVLDLSATPPVARTLAVGYRPTAVTFAADVSAAYVVTADGLSVIGLRPVAMGGPKLVRSLGLGDEATSSTETRDVSLTPQGGLALVRRDGSATLGAVDTTTGMSSTLTLGAAVTDADIDPSGTLAVAVIRDLSEVDLIPLPGGFDGTAPVRRINLPGEQVGSVTLSAGKALLFTNATASERLVTVDLTTGAVDTARLHAPVYTALPTADGLHALVLHANVVTQTGTGGAGATPGTGGIGGASTGGRTGGVGTGGTSTGGVGTGGVGTGGVGTGGASTGGVGTGGAGTGGASAPPSTTLVLGTAFSIVPLTNHLPARIQGMNARPQSTVLAPDGSWALVTERDDATGNHGVYVAQMPSLQIDRLGLASPPLAVGLVAGAGRGFVTQLHAEGRVSFVAIAPATGIPALRTLTGFELGSRVVGAGSH